MTRARVGRRQSGRYGECMLREGPIPRLAHGLIEYVVGAFLIAAPFLLGYDDVDMALGVSIATGVIILVLAAITQGPTGLVHQLPVSAHVTFDFLLAIFLIAAPFILGFADESAAARNLFIALGVAHLLISIGTRYRDAGPDAGPTSRHGSPPKRTTSTAPAPASSATPSRPPAATGSSAGEVERPSPAPRPAPEQPPTAPPA
jgi:hypothetical protein